MTDSTDILPITGFAREYRRVSKELRRDGRHRVLTIEGRPEMVVLGVDTFERLLDYFDAMTVDAAIDEALADPRPSLSLGEAEEMLSRFRTRKSS